MTTKISNFLKKRQKGQILVMLGLLFIGLLAVIGLAIDMGMVFVSFSRLNRAVDSAALAATGEFKRNYRVADMRAAAQQMLKLNSVDTTNTTSITIDTCSTQPSDPELCTIPPRKLVRVSVTQNVPLYFLSVLGVPSAPIQARALSEAASLDVMLVIDRSLSMTANNPKGTGLSAQDPKICNESDPLGNSLTSSWDTIPYTLGPDGLPGECHPFEDVKWAALSFVDRLNFEYDRLGIVVFDRLPHIGETMYGNTFSGLPLTGGVYNDPATPGNEADTAAASVIDAIEAMEVYEGSGLCPWDTGTKSLYPNDANLEPCRLYQSDGVTFQTLDCPNINQPPYDVSRCMTSNIGGGLALAGNALAGNYGVYAPYLPYTPAVRKESVWVVIIVSDGLSNAGYNPDAICPPYTWTRWPQCRDKDPYTRHDSSELSLYDGDDYARDMADIVASNSVFMFSVGLGDKVNLRDDRTVADPNCIPKTIDPSSSSLDCSAGQELLGYLAVGAAKEANLPTFAGTFYNIGNNPDQLERVFLDIYNKLTTKLAK